MTASPGSLSVSEAMPSVGRNSFSSSVAPCRTRSANSRISMIYISVGYELHHAVHCGFVGVAAFGHELFDVFADELAVVDELFSAGEHVFDVVFLRSVNDA